MAGKTQLFNFKIEPKKPKKGKSSKKKCDFPDVTVMLKAQDSPKDDTHHVNIFLTVPFNFKLSTRTETVGEALVEYLWFFKSIFRLIM